MSLYRSLEPPQEGELKSYRLNAVSALAVLILAYCAVYAGTHFLTGILRGQLHLQDVRQIAALMLTMSVLLLWSMFLIVYVILRLRGQTLESIGWHGSAPLRGWLLAIVLLVLYAGFMLAGPLHDAPYLSDWSPFRVVTAVGVGLSAGICEETIFRGFIMTQSRDAGLPVVVQILVSALLFALAHAGWGGSTGHLSTAALVGSMSATFLLGALFAAISVLSRRSLLPVAVAHAGIDLLIEPWLILYALSGGFAQS